MYLKISQILSLRRTFALMENISCISSSAEEKTREHFSVSWKSVRKIPLLRSCFAFSQFMLMRFVSIISEMLPKILFYINSLKGIFEHPNELLRKLRLKMKFSVARNQADDLKRMTRKN